MKILKTLILTTFLTIGFIVPSCNKDCDCPPESKLKFFDIEGLQANNFRQESNLQAFPLGENEAVALDKYFLELDFDVSFFGYQEPSFWEGFSMMNSALACSCADPGASGSKERIESLVFTTVNDFDGGHQAGANISDLIIVQTSLGNISLAEYLQTNTSEIKQPFISFQLNAVPTATDTFQTKVNLKLDNGEEYEATSGKVVIF